VYLEIQRRLDLKIDVALGHDSPNWHILNCCPACFYQLDDEPECKFCCFLSMDGNNSLKRLGEAVSKQKTRLDSRSIKSDCWLMPDEVDVFKDEVKVVIING
jgi:hypothetical protein